MLKRTVKIILGVLLIIAGIAGLVLPVIPGILLIFVGFAFIIDKNPKVLFKEVVAKAKGKYQKMQEAKAKKHNL